MMTTFDILDSDLSDRKKWHELDRKTRMYYEGMKEYRLREKLRISSNIMNRLDLNGSQRLRVKYLIKLNFKNLCRKCSDETIITAIAFYIKKENNHQIQLSHYSVCREYKLTEKLFSTIMVNLCSQLQKKQLRLLH